MKFSLTGTTNLRWPDVVEATVLAEELGFDAFYVNDHLRAGAGFARDQGTLDALTMLGGLAPLTSTIRLGCLVSPVTIRHPVLMARAAQTLDHMTGGRAELGMGAGWDADEHAAFGFAFPLAADRLTLLEDACRNVDALLRRRGCAIDDTDLDGHFPLRRAALSPPPVQARVPLVLGGTSNGAVAVAARWATRWNGAGSPAFLADRVARLRHEQVARDPRLGELEATAMVTAFLCRSSTEVECCRERVRALHGRSQGRSHLDGEDPASTAFIGPDEEFGAYLDGLARGGIERAVLFVPRPWDPATLRRLAAAGLDTQG